MPTQTQKNRTLNFPIAIRPQLEYFCRIWCVNRPTIAAGEGGKLLVTVASTEARAVEAAATHILSLQKAHEATAARFLRAPSIRALSKMQVAQRRLDRIEDDFWGIKVEYWAAADCARRWARKARQPLPNGESQWRSGRFWSFEAAGANAA